MSRWLPKSLASLLPGAAAAEDSISILQLWIFPIKSCAGFQVDSAEVLRSGLRYDREFMLVDASTHKFLTARTIPKMILIETSMDAAAQTLTITIPATETAASSTHSISLARPGPATFPEEDHHYDVQVWGSTTDGYSVGSPELIQALSTFMGREVMLVQKGEELREASYDGFIYSIPAAQGGAVFDYGAEEAPSIKFSDEFPLHIVTKESLEDLDRRVVTDKDVQQANGARFDAKKWKDGGVKETLVRFRANVVLQGTRGAWDEDWWTDITIGEGDNEVPLLVAQRCGRCQLPNVDPATAIRDPVVPDKFMEADRYNFPAIANGQKLTFGVQTVPKKSLGRISVGDTVVVAGRYTEKRPDGTVMRFEDVPYFS